MGGRMQLVLASGNPGKAREFERLLGGVFEVHPLPVGTEMPEETGDTFQENALIKAQAVFDALGGRCAVLAAASGLQVDALGGEPGVRSARFAGDGAGDAENVAKLLSLLEGETERTARFVCWLCLLLPAPEAGGKPILVEATGEANGVIESAPRGEDGFGYDPVFRPLGWGSTLAEAGPEDKDSVSHRGAAARRLRAALEERGVFICGS